VLGLQVVGCFVGFLFFVFDGAGCPFSWSVLAFSDSIVKGMFDIYLKISGACFISFYR